MADIKLPLDRDVVCRGTIFLKGERNYPDWLLDELEEKKKSMPQVQDSPIFRSDAPPLPTPPPPAVLEVPQPPTQQPVTPVTPAEQTGEDETPLPEDFPSKDLFEAAGFTTTQQVKAIEDLKTVPGIGQAKESEVQAWFSDHEEPAGEPE